MNPWFFVTKFSTYIVLPNFIPTFFCFKINFNKFLTFLDVELLIMLYNAVQYNYMYGKWTNKLLIGVHFQVNIAALYFYVVSFT